MRILLIGSGGEEKISRSQLKEIAHAFGNLVKAVVDVEMGVMAVGGELHSDEEAFLLRYSFRHSGVPAVEKHQIVPRLII
jgi:hypothetical protein